MANTYYTDSYEPYDNYRNKNFIDAIPILGKSALYALDDIVNYDKRNVEYNKAKAEGLAKDKKDYPIATWLGENLPVNVATGLAFMFNPYMGVITGGSLSARQSLIESQKNNEALNQALYNMSVNSALGAIPNVGKFRLGQGLISDAVSDTVSYR